MHLHVLLLVVFQKHPTWHNGRSNCLHLYVVFLPLPDGAFFFFSIHKAHTFAWPDTFCKVWKRLGNAVPMGKPLLSCTYLLTPWSRVLLEKLTGLQLGKKFPTFHGTRRFITAITSVRYLSLSWGRPIQSTYPHPTSRRSILILSTYLRLGLPSGLFPSGFPTKTLYTPLSSPLRTTCPAHLILLDFITHTILGEGYKSFSSSLCNLLHSPVTSSLLGRNILLNIMFINGY